MMKRRNRFGLFGLSVFYATLGFFLPTISSAATASAPATVVAEKGPVGLRLEVLRTKIHPGDPILVRLTLKNIGKKGFVVTDQLFAPHADIVGVLSMVGTAGFGIDLKLYDPSGREVFWDQPFSDGFCTQPDRESKPWDHTDISTAPLESTTPDKGFSRWLKPGESIQTGSWIPGGACPRPMTEEERALGFAQMPARLKPGRYAIRAVYDYRINKTFRSPGHDFPEGVKIVTPKISLDVDKK